MKKTKVKLKKQRANQYEKKLKINCSFESAIKVLISEPKADYKKKI